MPPLNPNGDLLRSTVLSEFVTELIRDMRDGPDVLVFLLSQRPDNYESIIKSMARFKESYITFSPQTVYGIPVGLCILGFDSSSPATVSDLLESLSRTPFDEAGIYIRDRLHLRLLPNEELQPGAA